MATGLGERVRRTSVATWVIVALVAFFGTEFSLAFRSPAPTPVQLLQEVLTAAGAADTCHYEAVWRADGISQIVVGDARPSSGSESVSVGADRFSVVFTGQAAYFDGDAAALRDQLGFGAAAASADSGKWISLQQSDGPYPDVEEGLTTSAALAQVMMAPYSVSPPHRTHGVLLSRISGRIPHGRVVMGSASLDVLSRSKLPELYSARGSDGGRPWSATIVFSHWGENVKLRAPTQALPFTSLAGTTAGSGTAPRS